MSFEATLRGKVGAKFKKTRGKNGVEYRINCPFCIKKGKSRDTKYKLYINPTHNGGVYNCYRCGTAGGTRSLLGWVGAEKPQPQQNQAMVSNGNVRMPGELVPVSMLDDEHPAVQYLLKGRKRPFDPMTMSAYYSVAYCRKGIRFGNGVDFMFDTTGTLIFPIFDNQELIGWQARMMTNPEDLTDSYLQMLGYPKDDNGEWILPPKYFTSPGFPKGRVLYNFDNAKTREPVVVTEGVFDAIAVGASGVALLGKGITETQMRILQTYCNHVIVMLDPDAGAESKEMVKLLKRSIKVTEVTIKGFGDPGDTPTEEIWRQISEVGVTPGLKADHHGALN